MPQIIQVGPVSIYMYGLIIGAAIAVGWWWFEKMGKRFGVPETVLTKTAGLAIGMGIIGARLYHVIDFWQYYSARPEETLYVWQGGLGIWGAIWGGLLGVLAAAGGKKEWRWKVFDAAAIVLPLSQAIGRLGNWVNYELFGKPTDLPWGIFIPEIHRPAGMERTTHYHPVFFYESICNLILFGILWWFGWKKKMAGQGKILAAYLIGYGIIRWGLEPLRINPWTIYGVPTAQIVSLMMIVVGICLYRRVGWKRE